ncbi:MAG: hypothetical protein O3B75_02230 [Planctomycetota bacterium]|nr:hypothetical protein [Planctomycetota bacterium]
MTNLLSIFISIQLSGIFAQSTFVPAPAQTTPIIIEHAIIHTAIQNAPVIQDGFVIMDNGIIVSVGTGAPTGSQGEAPPANAQRINATGMHLTPGFISSATTLGLIETQQVRATDDRTEFGPFHPEVAAWIAVNPDSNLIPVARLGGVLLALVFPQGGNVSGEASLIRLNGWTTDDLAVVPDVGTVLHWPSTEPAPRWVTTKNSSEQEKERRITLRAFDDFFDSAQAYSKARSANLATKIDLRFERLRDVLDGSRPLFIEAASAGQIESAILWSTRRGMKPIIVGGKGAPAVVDLLITHKVPVIVQGVLDLPRFAHEDYDSAYTLPARLVAKGIEVAIATGDEPSNDRNLVHHAAMAASFGMAREEALAAITRIPAQLCGVGDRYGVISVGHSATLLLHDGDPLEVKSNVRSAWLDGRSIEMKSHQTELKKKYDQKYAPKTGTATTSGSTPAIHHSP